MFPSSDQDPSFDCTFIPSRVIVTLGEHYAVGRKPVGCNPISVFLNKYPRYVSTLDDEAADRGTTAALGHTIV